MSITEMEVLDQCISDLLTSTQDIRTPRSSLLNSSLNQLVSTTNLVVTFDTMFRTINFCFVSFRVILHA
jgi:hypothetical protein